MDHDHVVSHVARIGLDGIDVGLFADRSHIQPKMVLADVERSAGLLAERVAAHGLALSDVFLVPSPSLEALAVNHPDAAVRGESLDIFSQVLDFVRLAGGDGMTINPGVLFPGESVTASIRRSAGELRRRVDLAGARGVALSVEGGVGTNTETPEALLELVDATPGLKVSLDYAHFVYQGFDETRADPLLAHCRHLHCRGGAPGRMQTTFRENTIDYDRVMTGLESAGFDGCISIEYVWVDIWDCFRTENTMETILFRDWWRARLARSGGDA
jgi:sugar phosphate isomerase/epimerase